MLSAKGPLTALCLLQNRRQPHLAPLAPGVVSAKLHGPEGSFGWIGAGWPSAYISKRKELLGSAASNGVAAIDDRRVALHVGEGSTAIIQRDVGLKNSRLVKLGVAREGVLGKRVRWHKIARQPKQANQAASRARHSSTCLLLYI